MAGLDYPALLILLGWAELPELVELAGLGWSGWLGWLGCLGSLVGSLAGPAAWLDCWDGWLMR